MMDNCTLRISDFEVSFFWNQEGKLSSIELQPSELRTTRSSDLPEEFTGPVALKPLVEQVKKYFLEGVPIQISDWDLFDWTDISDFQKEVYKSIAQVPHGETRTYHWVAQRVGKPMACRAVGQALKRNKFPVVIPCHRIVGSSGIGGFMGKTASESPEIFMKSKLIEIEHFYRNPLFPFLVPTSSAELVAS